MGGGLSLGGFSGVYVRSRGEFHISFLVVSYRGKFYNYSTI